MKPATKKYNCEPCGIHTDNQATFNTHNMSGKHLRNIADVSSKFKCTRCAKKYSTQSGLWRHNQECEPIVQVTYTQEEVNKLLDENTAAVRAEKTQQTVNINNNIVNNIQIGNYQSILTNIDVFVNDRCHAAPNLDDFINDTTVTQLSQNTPIFEHIGYCVKAGDSIYACRRKKRIVKTKINFPIINHIAIRLCDKKRDKWLHTLKTTKTIFGDFAADNLDYDKILTTFRQTVTSEDLPIYSCDVRARNPVNSAVNFKLQCELLVESTILEQYADNVECVYFGIIDNKSKNGESLIKFGNSNDLNQRVAQHKAVYTNFRLAKAYRVKNKRQIENAIKTHSVLSGYRRTITVKNINYIELLAYITPEQLHDIVKNIISYIEYSPINYVKLTECYQKAIEENTKLSETNGNLISIVANNPQLLLMPAIASSP